MTTMTKAQLSMLLSLTGYFTKTMRNPTFSVGAVSTHIELTVWGVDMFGESYARKQVRIGKRGATFDKDGNRIDLSRDLAVYGF